jgi:hypothetical protein
MWLYGWEKPWLSAAASSACEMVLVIPTPLGLTYWDMFRRGWYTPDPVDKTLNTTPNNIWAIHLVVCRLLPPKASPISVLQVGCCVSLHPLSGTEKKASFLIHADSVDTVYILHSFFLLLGIRWLEAVAFTLPGKLFRYSWGWHQYVNGCCCSQ